MRTPLSWYVLLVSVITIAPYVLGIPPRTPQQWRYVAITIAFLTWLLLGFASVRAA